MFEDVAMFMLVGLLAQFVDGALGMAYGVTSNSLLLGLGVPPAAASASVHAAEVFTTGVSGFSHWKLGNVDRQLVLKLAGPGMIGAFLGAYVLTSIDGDVIKPVVSAYLLVMGVLILTRAFKNRPAEAKPVKRVSLLGLIGAFLDAVGGGGWGPVVASSLIGRGSAPRFVIGSVNASEFFVTTVASATFLFTIGFTHWQAILGLVAGGVLAAPFAAYATKHVKERPLMFAVGLLVVGLSIRGLMQGAGAFRQALTYLGMA